MAQVKTHSAVKFFQTQNPHPECLTPNSNLQC